MCLFITKKEALGTPTHAESTDLNVCIDEQHVWILVRMATHAVGFLVSEIITEIITDTTLINGGTYYYPFVFMLIRPTGLTLA